MSKRKSSKRSLIILLAHDKLCMGILNVKGYFLKMKLSGKSFCPELQSEVGPFLQCIFSYTISENRGVIKTLFIELKENL